MNSTSPDPQSPPGAENQADVDERIRRMREERVRKSLDALGRDPLIFGRAAGAQTLLRVTGIVFALLALWWVIARLGF